MAKPDDNGDVEARRILDRVARESAADGASFMVRSTNRVRDHLKASDVDQDDRIEVIGTKIGRAIGFVITLAIIGWLIFYILGGG
jgi:hypothetical protein